MAVFLPAPLLS